MLRIAVVAGEASGDTLAAALLEDLRTRYGEIAVEGIGGEKMQAQGCVCLFPMEKLSVMGIAEVLPRLPELLKIRSRLIQHFVSNPPDLFIGVDAPDFNLALERALKRAGIPVIHYVSPSVWAWRGYRIKKIARSVDQVLNLFPFELEIYQQNNIAASFVGHPLARQISLKPDTAGARQRLGLAPDEKIIGILPGSREREIRKLLPEFLKAAALLQRSCADVQFICGLLDERALQQSQQIRDSINVDIPLQIYTGRTHDVLEASDVLLLASGTITLEAMLFKKPMVVAYQLNPLTHLLVKSLAHVRHASLPNLLAGREIVPECLQADCKADLLARHLQNWMGDREGRAALVEEFTRLHNTLRGDSDEAAAQAVARMLASREKADGT